MLEPRKTVLCVMQESIIEGITWPIGREVKTEELRLRSTIGEVR